MLAVILASLCPRPGLHHPILVLHPDHFQGLAGEFPWGA